MMEQIIKFIDKDVDGNGTDIIAFAKIYGDIITIRTVNRIKKAITNYKNENEGEWNTDGCLEVAQEQLETEGYEVYWINEDVEIYF